MVEKERVHGAYIGEMRIEKERVNFMELWIGKGEYKNQSALLGLKVHN